MSGRLSRNEKHFGTYVSKGEEKEAYIQWDTTTNGGGFILRDAKTARVLVPTAYRTLVDMRMADVDFTVNRSERLPETVA